MVHQVHSISLKSFLVKIGLTLLYTLQYTYTFVIFTSIYVAVSIVSAGKPLNTTDVTESLSGSCNTTHIKGLVDTKESSAEVALPDGNKLQLQAGEYNYTYINKGGEACRVHISVTRKCSVFQTRLR